MKIKLGEVCTIRGAAREEGKNQGVPVTGHHTSIPGKNRKVRFASQSVIFGKIRCPDDVFGQNFDHFLHQIGIYYIAARAHRWRVIGVPTLCWSDGWPDHGDFLADVDLQVSPMRFSHVGVVQTMLKTPPNRVWGRPTEKKLVNFWPFFGGLAGLGVNFGRLNSI